MTYGIYWIDCLMTNGDTSYKEVRVMPIPEAAVLFVEGAMLAAKIFSDD